MSEQKMRFQVVEGSESAHCCFDATVVDTHKPYLIRGEQYIRDGVPQWESICEAFSMEDAQAICDAMNAREALAQQPDAGVELTDEEIDFAVGWSVSRPFREAIRKVIAAHEAKKRNM